MKKLLAVILLALTLTGCDETNILSSGSGQYKYIHIQFVSGTNPVHDEIKHYTYCGSGTFVQVETKTYGWIALNDGFMLYNSDRCPICNK